MPSQRSCDGRTAQVMLWFLLVRPRPGTIAEISTTYVRSGTGARACTRVCVACDGLPRPSAAEAARSLGATRNGQANTSSVLSVGRTVIYRDPTCRAPPPPRWPPDGASCVSVVLKETLVAGKGVTRTEDRTNQPTGPHPSSSGPPSQLLYCRYRFGFFCARASMVARIRGCRLRINF